MEISTFPAVITCPGKYIITEDLVFSSSSNTINNLITVNACNVTIDLMGHSLSLSETYRYKNRWMNLIYSKHSIRVRNGTLGMCSGYSIKSGGDIHCDGVIFTLYELGAAFSDSYISLSNCTVQSPNPTYSLYAYDYSRRMITVSFDIISNHSNALPITVIGQLSQYSATLENLLDFVLEQFNMGIVDIRFFSNVLSYRSENVIHAPKVKICNSNITIPTIGTRTYTEEKLTYTATNAVILDVGSFPLQYISSVTIPELANVVWYSGYISNLYNLPYYRMPADIIDYIKNLQPNPPAGYSLTNISYEIIIIWANDLKISGTALTCPSTTVSILITNSRYVRCVDCTIGGIFRIVSSKSVKITSSTITQLVILSVECIILCNNIIALYIMHNISPNISIKSK